jgi:hypothetical protein
MQAHFCFLRFIYLADRDRSAFGTISLIAFSEPPSDFAWLENASAPARASARLASPHKRRRPFGLAPAYGGR